MIHIGSYGRPFLRPWVLLAAGCISATAVSGANSAAAVAPDGSLLDLSIEELLHVEITSAAKKVQRISETAAAAFVITRDDIRRSGARSIPEVLRMAPGIEVAQIDANKWAVTARGFNGRFANKLLVLMDGRALYTPSFSGVFWDVQDTVMEDIERIEIIRGPGGTLWGANAVNGVINIITRSSTDTQGSELVATSANGPSQTASLRYGGKVDQSISYRLYTKYSDEAGNEDLSGNSTADKWHMGRIGGRADWTPDSRDEVSVTTEAYRGDSGETLMRSLLQPPYTALVDSQEAISGFFAVANWHRQFGPGRELQAQAYFDQTRRATVLFGENRNTAVLDVQYRFQLGARQDVVAGAGARYNAYQFGETADISVTPHDPSNAGFNTFLQDEVQLVADRLALTVGVDLEHNPLSERDVDALPSGRLLWTLNDSNHLWAAVTQAISTPSYEDIGASVRNAAPPIPPGSVQNPFPVPIVTSVVPNPAVGSEKLVAYEVGYRTLINSTVTLDAAVYLHDYRSLRGQGTTGIYCEPSQIAVTVDPACVIGATDVVNRIAFQNAIRGHSSGLELAADWAPFSQVRFRGTYTYLHMSLEPTQPGEELNFEIAAAEGQSPKNQFSLRADVTLTHFVDLDVSVRHVDALPSIPVPEYWSADANIVWRVSPQLELALSGRNLLQKAHVEFVSELSDVVPTQIERTIAAKIRWTF